MTPTGDFVFPERGLWRLVGFRPRRGRRGCHRSVSETPDAPPGVLILFGEDSIQRRGSGGGDGGRSEHGPPHASEGASQLVAANVRLERERRALVERLGA